MIPDLSFLDYSEEVFSAIAENKPVVALESTLIAHGMPYPENMETAMELEQIIRAHGAIPATIAVIKGRLQIGLDKKTLIRLAKGGSGIMKVSRRDLPYVVAKRDDGATTVAGTMIIARMAGIKIFATGGIGGVHRGATTTMDISADLEELSRTSVAVVSAGAKAILDLGLTLEYLETKGVPVVGYKTAAFPGFYTSATGLPVDFKMNHVKEIADFLYTKWTLGLEGGVVIANPVPEEDSLPSEEVEKIILEALNEASLKGIKGKSLTPFLLAKIETLTNGQSLATNIALVKNNAKLAAEVAVEYSKLI